MLNMCPKTYLELNHIESNIKDPYGGAAGNALLFLQNEAKRLKKKKINLNNKDVQC